ncbi:2-succinyl-5-enolpyruvyl-6-hydroxy-3-cyclohexene-1-carboxylic-acid synthase [Erwiniaceae bacterium BAC15a-03b]|uniref:2-succinyl-5-enolpyruvyl-6-hydroxy-3-cyclohexene-1-carboxylate synthase n=1 Tax=Winslowiella arboricola TaxID=2978220 RepID=A0A9J6PN28_9GAMM|nr:2-succinyl-5-enolpyruvyl-6-hydroxy-3-cyclohexene-1-carboxylic-acid synthase [Winslowiella arboricola]MCU5771313.1 2-succinyl-5-enolpyruvyl-6-hydroxy-3-cyclohexene-1-carboxylic-acid synthase [Winslowiella arboricola]MCU5777056.1 2-succinyl-5-enolpyruvyl-6-hydroxy-3-cyclohexene-1-carboxylic-acid synthase [Winslowiella arboricola]
MSISTFNHRWAEVIIETLTRHGVHHICIAPGSRSAPLTLAAAANHKLVCHTHFDERGLGHLALGLAKSSGQAVAMIVTSGTALANLYPAVIEARLTGERLVAISADRPPELIGCGANQAIDQSGIFAGYAEALNLPRPTPEISACWLVAALDELLSRQRNGAVQINVPLAEPLYGEDNGEHMNWRDNLADWWQGSRPWVTHRQWETVESQEKWRYWQQRRGVVIAGGLTAAQGQRVANWAQQLGWPLLADVQSQTGSPLPAADLWLGHPQAQHTLAQAEIIVQFGSKLTSKRLLQWQASQQVAAFWLIDPLPGRREAANLRGNRIVADIDCWLDQHPPQCHTRWARALEPLVTRTQREIAAACEAFGEAQLAHRLPQLLPKGGQLFIGNSLMVRLVDALAQLPAGYPVYANRGASGIDGLLSTAAGVQRGHCVPTLVILGDISALYDLNALALLRNAPAPLVLMVVNNNGGQIFSLLPTPAAQRERFFCMPQHLHFEHAAAMFGLHYARPQEWQALQQSVASGWQREGVTLIELVVEPQAGADTLKQLVNQVAAL